jgi:hypothetical protein
MFGLTFNIFDDALPSRYAKDMWPTANM